MAEAGRPLVVDDAEPVDAGAVQVEGGVAYVKAKASNHFDFPLTLTYGLIPGLEAGIASGGVFHRVRETAESDSRRTTGFGDLALSTKWKAIHERDYIPAFSSALTVKFPTADDEKDHGTGERDYDITVILSKDIGGWFALHGNVGYTFVGVPRDHDWNDVVHYGLAAERALSQRTTLVGEVFVSTALERRGQKNPVGFNVGLRHEVVRALTLDVGLGTAISGDRGPDAFLTVGFTWIFGLRRAGPKTGL
ncbi:MAG: transporter [Planctomycetes bacterium]|nr:transporter [Planctomycetota bacterium]